jgi:hypothetical protein
MYSSLSQIITISTDALLSVIAFAVFLRPSLRKQYPWMFAYLSARAITGVIVEFILYGPLLASPLAYTKMYFVVWWSSYLILTSLLFMGCLDAYRQAMAPLPGLARMGTTIFRWAAVASILITATTVTSIASGPKMFMHISLQVVRCTGSAELCLVALLLLSMKAIGLSLRCRPFGIALGLGIMAAVDCVQATVTSMQLSSNLTLQAVIEAIVITSLGLWIAYAVLPEPARKTVTVPVNSAIYKWDQIASALGHKGTQVAVQPAPSFFLVDVEKVVERAFVRTLKGKESESS